MDLIFSHQKEGNKMVSKEDYKRFENGLKAHQGEEEFKFIVDFTTALAKERAMSHKMVCDELERWAMLERAR